MRMIIKRLFSARECFPQFIIAVVLVSLLTSELLLINPCHAEGLISYSTYLADEVVVGVHFYGHSKELHGGATGLPSSLQKIAIGNESLRAATLDFYNSLPEAMNNLARDGTRLKWIAFSKITIREKEIDSLLKIFAKMQDAEFDVLLIECNIDLSSIRRVMATKNLTLHFYHCSIENP